jgi:hypothetical protein
VLINHPHDFLMTHKRTEWPAALVSAATPSDVCPPAFSKIAAAVRMKRIVVIFMAKIPIETQPFFIHEPGCGRQISSSQELLELLGDGSRYGDDRMLSRFPPILPNRHVIPLMKTKS